MQYENNHDCSGTKFKSTADTTVMCCFDELLKEMLNFHYGEGCLQASRDGLCCAQGQLESWAVFCPLSVPSPASWGPGRTVHALCLQAKALQPRYPRLREEPLASRGRHWGPHRVLGRGFGAPGLQAPQGLCPVCAPHGKTLRTLAPSGPEGAP